MAFLTLFVFPVEAVVDSSCVFSQHPIMSAAGASTFTTSGLSLKPRGLIHPHLAGSPGRGTSSLKATLN